jgi:hypothetical protein
MFNFVDEHGPPSLLWVRREAALAGRSAGLVGEDLGTTVFPSQGMRAQQALLAVVASADRSALDEGLLEDRPGGWPGDPGHAGTA